MVLIGLPTARRMSSIGATKFPTFCANRHWSKFVEKGDSPKGINELCYNSRHTVSRFTLRGELRKSSIKRVLSLAFETAI